MSLTTEVQNLTTATTSLLAAVQTSKSQLDGAVATATEASAAAVEAAAAVPAQVAEQAAAIAAVEENAAFVTRNADGAVTSLTTYDGGAFHFPVSVPSSAASKNYAVQPEINLIDTSIYGATVYGSGSSTFPNKIGAVSKPVGTDNTNSAEWSEDTGYSAATLNDASLSTILGGYDNIANQIASVICGGGHNFISYHVEGHSAILSGSYNWVDGGRGYIFSGTNNRVSGTQHNVVFSGYTNKILSGSYHAIINGEANTINSSGAYCTIAGRNNSISGSSKDTYVLGRLSTAANDDGSFIGGGYAVDFSGTLKSGSVGGNSVDLTSAQMCGVLGGENITMTGTMYSASIGGRVNTQTGRSSAMVAAEESNDNGARGLFTGRKANGLGAYYHTTIGCNHPTSGVISQAMKVAQGATTTGSSLNAPTEQVIAVGNTGKTTITGTCHVTARNTTDSKNAGYKVDFVAYWDGVNYKLNGVTSDLAMTEIYSDDSSNITAPTLAFNAGQLRVRFGGTTGKTINWSASIDCTLMRS